MRKRRAVAIGLDAASPRLLKKWASDGTLPVLAKLLRDGRSGSLRGLEGFYIGSTWPSLFTGTTPADHGFHYQQQLVPGTYELRRMADGPGLGTAPFWRRLSHSGLRVAVLDVPLASPEDSLNGIQVVEWGVHDELFGFQTFPRELETKVLSSYGRHPVGSFCDASGRSEEQYIAFAEHLVSGIDAKTRMTLDLLHSEPWDFFIQVFSEAHCVGHQCWHMHDRNHPGHDERLLETRGDPVRRVYAALDRAVGKLIEDLDDCLVVVFTAHGMTHWYGVQFMFREILFKLGAAVPVAGQQEPQAMGTLRSAWRRLPGSVRSRMKPLKDLFIADRIPETTSPGLGVDPLASACIPVNNGLGTAGIRLNVAGRESSGVLKPGPELEAYVDALTSALTGLIDVQSGRPLVHRVLRTGSLYQGALLDHLPDLVVEWSRSIPVGSSIVSGGKGAQVTAHSERFGRIVGRNTYGRTGEHEPDGFFVIRGPGVGPGERREAASILDLAPTFCQMCGVHSNDYPGRPIPLDG